MSGARERVAVIGAVAALTGLVVGAGAVGAALTEEKPTGPDARAVSTVDGTPRLVEVVVQDGQASTSSTSLTDVPGMTITHHSPSDFTEYLVVTVSGFSRCHDDGGAASAWCEISVEVDGQAADPAGRNIFDSVPSDGNDVNAWEFHTAQFTAAVSGGGTHVVRLEYRVDEAGATFSLDNITMKVETLAAGTGAGGDGLYNEGLLCFEVGERIATIDLSGAYDVTKSSMGFATLQRSAGDGRYIRFVRLYVPSDVLKIVLSKPAKKAACAAWHIVELEFAG